MRRLALPFLLVPSLLTLPGCHQGYSPNTYASDAAQEEANVQRGIIIGVRQVMISANGTIGAATGGAAGGVAGSQVAGAPLVTALGAIGGTLVGGIGGAAAAHAVADTKGWEYIVQEEPDAKLVSVTQTSKTPLSIGLHVLVIAGTQQARIVPDYTVQVASAAPAPKPVLPSPPTPPPTFEVDINPALPAPATAEQGAPLTVASDPANPPAASPAAATLAPGATAPPVQPSPGTPAAPAQPGATTGVQP